jgi:anti-sigma factor RsiW
MRTRLTVAKNLAEAGVSPQRDPRTFRPPGEAERAAERAAERTAPPAEIRAVPGEAMPPRPSVPSSVLLPPPQVAAPAAGYELPPWFLLGPRGFGAACDVAW